MFRFYLFFSQGRTKDWHLKKCKHFAFRLAFYRKNTHYSHQNKKGEKKVYLHIHAHPLSSSIPELFILRLVSWSDPCSRCPLRFILSSPHRGQQLHTCGLQAVVYYHMIKELTVMLFHIASCIFYLLKIFILSQERENTQINGNTVLLKH